MLQDTKDYLSAACFLVMQRENDETGGVITAAEVKGFLKAWTDLDIPMRFIEECLEELAEADSILVHRDMYARTRYEFTKQSDEIFQSALNDPTDITTKMNRLGYDWIGEVLGNVLAKEVEAAGGDPEVVTEKVEDADVWEPLPLERSSPEYKKAVEAIEEATKAIEQNNGFATSEPETRNSIVDSLRTGIEWLKSKTPTRDQVKAFLLSPLKYVAKKFGDSSVGALAKRAIEALITWLF